MQKLLFSLGFVIVSIFFLHFDVEASVVNEDESMCILENEEMMDDVVQENYAYYEELMEHVVFENNQYSFDANSASNNGLDDFDIEAGKSLVYFKNQELIYGEESVFDEANEAGNEMIEPYAWYRYGNYCGPGNSGGTPINPVDRTCMTHDNCYASNGWGNCQCDNALIGLMSAHAGNSNLSAGQRAFAGGAAAHFASRVALGLCSS